MKRLKSARSRSQSGSDGTVIAACGSSRSTALEPERLTCSRPPRQAGNSLPANVAAIEVMVILLRARDPPRDHWTLFAGQDGPRSRRRPAVGGIGRNVTPWPAVQSRAAPPGALRAANLVNGGRRSIGSWWPCSRSNLLPSPESPDNWRRSGPPGRLVLPSSSGGFRHAFWSATHVVDSAGPRARRAAPDTGPRPLRRAEALGALSEGQEGRIEAPARQAREDEGRRLAEDRLSRLRGTAPACRRLPAAGSGRPGLVQGHEQRRRQGARALLLEADAQAARRHRESRDPAAPGAQRDEPDRKSTRLN